MFLVYRIFSLLFFNMFIFQFLTVVMFENYFVLQTKFKKLLHAIRKIQFKAQEKQMKTIMDFRSFKLQKGEEKITFSLAWKKIVTKYNEMLVRLGKNSKINERDE